MSTPVSVTTPPHSRSLLASPTSPNNNRNNNNPPIDLQAHMQRMIDLQYEQQRFYDAVPGVPLPTTMTNNATGQATEAVAESSLAAADRDGQYSKPEDQPHENHTATATTASRQQQHHDLNEPQSPFPDANVGRGTLIWRSSPASEQQRLWSQQHYPQQQQRIISADSTLGDADDLHQHLFHPSMPLPADRQRSNITTATTDGPQARLLQKTITPHYSLASYGATAESTTNTTATSTTRATTATTLGDLPALAPPPPPPPSLPHNTNQPLPNHRSNAAANDAHHNHGGAGGAYLDDRHYVAQHVQDAFRRHEERERKRRQWSVYNCLHFMLGPCYKCWYSLVSATSLHRSFCYGAIDGMLTGAGIVSTFCGMHLLSTTTNNAPPIRALVVAFTAATCCADAVCMALGHMWTTHVLATAQAAERAEALQQLHQSKADAKGLLVDMLLSKGMLKIDAMSLADTLEGYPDLFVSALIGESLSGGISSSAAATTHSINTSARHEHMHYPTLRQPDMLTSSEHRNLMLFERRGDDDISPGGVDGTNAATPPSTDHATSPRHSEHWQHYPSYGRLSEADMDPNTYLAQSAEAESRKESLCMMLGFSLFAVIPSLIYTWVPAILFGSHDAAGIHVNPSSQHVAAFVNPNTLVISLTACVMWCLGVWKSRFLDSNWLMFGIETVLVLLVCITVAYGLGALLNKLFLPNDYLLEVVKHIVPAESGLASSATTTVTATVKSSSRQEDFPLHHFFLF